MQQFNVDIFDRSMSFVDNAVIDATSIDDDYVSASLNIVEIPSTQLVENGQFIRLQNKDYYFFGLITEVSPGEFATRIGFKSFLTVFDEEVLFDTNWQGTGRAATRPTLETVIRNFISDTYINPSDTYQSLPLVVNIDATITEALDWSFGIRPEKDTSHYAVANLYSDVIVRAIKEYGIAITVEPVFYDHKIHLTITKRPTPFKISADQNNVVVKTLKYSDKNVGINKLIVYNADNYNQSLTFYVHPDKTWNTTNSNRITPVVRGIKLVTPQESTVDSFVEAATEAAYSELSSSSWDNCIELEVYADDVNITPMELYIGQVVEVYYKGASYKSILTGRVLDGDKITLIFGSERIEYTKRRKLNGGK